MNQIEYDELKIYRGNDITINRNIIITQPTLGQIEEFGERLYFNAIHTLTSVGADMKWQLWDIGIDYTTIDDYDLFIKLIWQLVSSKKRYLDKTNISPELASEISQLTADELNSFKINPLQLVLKDIDLGDFIPCENKKINQIILYDKERDITIDRYVYAQITDIIRRMHGLKRNSQLPANDATKMDLIEDARNEALASQNQPYKSVLKPLVSALINHPGFKYGHNEVWDMKINAFFDSIQRIRKIQDSQLLLQGAYSGFADLKGIDKERLNWVGDI